MEKKIETLHKLCEALIEELEEYSKKIEKADGMSAGDLEAVDKSRSQECQNHSCHDGVRRWQ